MIKHGIELRFLAEGAKPEDIERGEAAAWAVFETAGVNPWATAAAAFKQEGEIEDISMEEAKLADLWRKAHAVAVEVCCGRGNVPPNDLQLESGIESIYDGSTCMPTP